MELRHIKAVRRSYCHSGKNKWLGQMLITNQHIDKLAAAHTFFNSHGMLNNYPGSAVNLLGILSDQIMRQPQANHVNPGLSMQPVLERHQTSVDEHERYNARAEDDTEARVEIRLVMTPYMVGSTWPRVCSTLGSDCLPTLSQGTILLYLFMDLLIVIFLSLCAHVRCLMSGDLGVVLVRFIYLLIMRVGTRSHGTLYPMTGCVLYLGGLLCW